MDASPASSSELPMALPISSATGRPLLMDRPRSPPSARCNQTRYCTGMGLSRPYWALTMLTVSWEASEGSTAESGSPGARYTSEKHSTVTASVIGSAASRRLRK